MATTPTPLPPLVGIGGKLGHGKDVVADALVANHGFVKVNMSTPIDKLMRILDPQITVGAATVRYAEYVGAVGFTDAKKHPEVRRLLQALGAMVRDEIDRSYWLTKAAEQIAELRAAGRPVVLSGVRFPNEAEQITAAGGTLIWVDRPGHTAIASAAADATENSIGQDDFHTTVANDGTLAMLELKAKLLGSQLLRDAS